MILCKSLNQSIITCEVSYIIGIKVNLPVLFENCFVKVPPQSSEYTAVVYETVSEHPSLMTIKPLPQVLIHKSCQLSGCTAA